MSSVAIQGGRGSYSEEAAIQLLGAEATILECTDLNETFRALASRAAEFAVVPVKNKIIGVIEPARSLIGINRVRVIEEFPLPVHHLLAGLPGARFADLQAVRSQAEALRQCGVFLTANPQLVPIFGPDTALSVKQVMDDGDGRIGAIASRRAAELYGAAILREEVADDPDNWTTFALLTKPS
jgi:prephenate dehydratase